MNSSDLIGLTLREQQALQALMDKRDVYIANRQHIAARIMGVAIWLVWQVFQREHKA